MAKSHVPSLAKNGHHRVEIGGRNFWLGKEHQIAVRLTNALDIAWANEKSTNAQGKKCWSQKSIDTAFNLVGVKPPKTANSIEPPPAPVPHPTPYAPTFRPAYQSREINFHQALDLYVKMRLGLQTIRRAGEDSEQIVDSLKHNIPDCPLHSIDAAVQKTMADKIISRPANRTNGDPIAIVTARKWLQELGAAFEWFSHPDSRIGWIPPYPQWREKFSVTDDQAKAIAKNQGDTSYGKVKPTFNLDQLAILHKNTTPLDRLYLLGGVCLGWTAIEFATLTRDQIQQDDNGDTYIINKERSKTGVEMSFWVCPELAKLIHRSVNATPPNPANLAMMTRNRQGQPLPLVHGSTDTVGQSWERLMRRVNKFKQQVPNYPHSRLRKLAGQLVENITGNHDLAQMLLSHKRRDVASTNYVGLGINVGVGKSPQQRLWDAQREVHKALAPVLQSLPPTAKPKRAEEMESEEQIAA